MEFWIKLIVYSFICPFVFMVFMVLTGYTVLFGIAGFFSQKPSMERNVARFFAWLFEFGIFTIAYLAIFPEYVFGLVSLGGIFTVLATVSFALFFVIGSVIFMIISAYMESRFGQTLFKKLFSLRVVDENGERLSFKRALVRNMGKVFLTPIDCLGVLKDGRRFTERWAGSYVVDANQLGKPKWTSSSRCGAPLESKGKNAF